MLRAVPKKHGGYRSKPKEDTAKADGSGFTYILIGIAAVAVIGVVYVVKSKKIKGKLH